ncbi:unnamed protein product [Heligmosomoides polygyrus]|uniref:MFS domain-containing protein n=1 Tax=Heligmosomoides polygyrus TaxID=6339 RepID=A0A3P7U1W9_HELPZ|nr:unnamed protein product [Heligmosomoides polygyrus]
MQSFIYPCINTIVANWFPVDERSTAVALFTTGNQVALFLGNPLAAGLCDSSFGWPAVYYISGWLKSSLFDVREFIIFDTVAQKSTHGRISPRRIEQIVGERTSVATVKNVDCSFLILAY